MAASDADCPPPHPAVRSAFVQTVHAKGLPPRPPPDALAPPPLALQYPAARRVVAVGDVHGDLRKCAEAFRLAGLTDARHRWIGGDTVVVQVGDQLDRGPDEVGCLYFLRRLSEEAQAAGGAVHVMMGNHEAMNVRGQFRYATPAGMADFAQWGATQRLGTGLRAACGEGPGQCAAGRTLAELGAVVAEARKAGKNPTADAARGTLAADHPAVLERTAACEPGGPVATRFFGAAPVVLQVGSTVFAHGGILPDHIEAGVERINREAREWCEGRRRDMPRHLQGGDAVVWTRRFSHEDRTRCECDRLGKALARMPGARRMVVGHTIQNEGVNGACGGRVLRVDVGMSVGCGDSAPEVLEIRDDGRELWRIRAGGVRERVAGVNPEPENVGVEAVSAAGARAAA